MFVLKYVSFASGVCIVQ